jgi:hypothetical protein
MAFVAICLTVVGVVLLDLVLYRGFRAGRLSVPALALALGIVGAMLPVALDLSGAMKDTTGGIGTAVAAVALFVGKAGGTFLGASRRSR